MNKHAKYRAKLAAQGRCQHCGMLSAPYTVCEERRVYKKMLRTLKRMTESGALIKQGSVYKVGEGPLPIQYETLADDRRLLPRIGKRPADESAVTALCIAIIGKSRRPLSTIELYALYAKMAKEPHANHA